MNESAATITAQDFQELFSGQDSERLLHLGKCTAPSSPWLPEVLDQIDSFVGLPPGWDSYGADSPRPDLLRGARALICSVARGGIVTKPFVYPARSGGVQFEWEHGSRYIEIEVVGEFAATYHFSDSTARNMISGEVFQKEALDELLRLIQQVEVAA